MTYLIMGCLAFVFLFVFDINKIKTKIEILNSMFALGASLIFYASIMLIINTPQDFEVSLWGVVLFSTLSFISGVFMFYALFKALPFKKTYVQVNHNQVIDSGIYALCRHPGVWGFFLMYLFGFLASGRWIILVACILWTIMDILHVWIQDVYFFPKMLHGYTAYQKNTPFLIFNSTSIERCLNTFGNQVSP